MNPKKIYIGDGVYAEYDGFQYRLSTDRGAETHEIFLDHQVLRQFFDYIEYAQNCTITLKRNQSEWGTIQVSPAPESQKEFQEQVKAQLKRQLFGSEK